jgi:SsrA-binding protein
MSTDKKAARLNIQNRSASFEYDLLLRIEAGIQLTGTEIKSVRAGKVSLAEAYGVFVKNELFLRNMHIEEYAQGNIFNHEPKRDRKLLLKKIELHKLQTKLKDKGLTIIPLRMFLSESGYAKVEIALAKGRKLYDKRERLKQKDLQRSLQRGES